MTVKEIEVRIAKIGALQSDPEAQHAETDQLYLDVLEFIAISHEQDRGPAWLMGYDNDRDLAAAVLKVKDIPTEWSACA